MADSKPKKEPTIDQSKWLAAGTAAAGAAGLGAAMLLVGRANDMSPQQAATDIFTDPHAPAHSVPVDAQTSRLPADMQEVAEAVAAAKAKSGATDGMSGATKKDTPATEASVRGTAPTFVEQVGRPETRAEKEAREKAYRKAVNEGLLVERPDEKIDADKNHAIQRIFDHMMRPQNPEFSNIPSDDGALISQREYYRVIEEMTIRDAMKNPAATPQEVRSYFNGLSDAEKAALTQRILEARDVGGAFGMQSFNPIMQALNEYLAQHPELMQSPQRGR